MRKSLATLFLVFSIAATASAGETAWLEVRSAHFIILTDSNQRQGRRIASQFERMRAVFKIVVPAATADPPTPIVVLALKDKSGFQALEPTAYVAKGQLVLGGLFLRGNDKNYILLRLDLEGKHPFEAIYHEYTHFMLSKASDLLPLWLNEGLAEFYQNTDIQDKEVLIGEPSADNILFLRSNRLVPLTTLLMVDAASPYYHEEDKVSIFYAESWALTHYIEITDHEKNVHRLQDYVHFLANKEDPVTAAQRAFGDLNQLQKALDAYVAQGSFQMFKLKTAVSVDESEFKIRAVPTPEADAIRADVLVYDHREKDAQVLLAATLRDAPENALAHETMGYLKFREGDLAAAMKWYGEAVKLDSHSYLAHYHYATLSMHTGAGDDAQIESSLRTSIALNPAFAPAFDALAMFYAARHEKLEEAHLLNVQAAQLEPDNLNYRLNAAWVLLMGEQYEAANAVLQSAVRLARNPQQLATVRERIDEVQSAQTRQKQQQTASSQVATQSTVSFGRGTAVGPVPQAAEGPKYPAVASGPRHTAKGILRGVKCFYPAVITLNVEQAGKVISLYHNNFYKLDFTAVNYTPEGDIHPCTELEGMKARVSYAETTDKTIGGQILSIELSK